MNNSYTISNYLIDRLLEIGVNHLFGVPGDYNLDFLDNVLQSPIQWVGNCNELNAGYAADGYARLNGVGAAVVTYGVGGFSILNAVAGAFAEHVPLVIINGAPSATRRESGALVHHLVSNYYLQLDIYKKITADAALLTDHQTAPEEIDRVLKKCIQRKLPVYIELPLDINFDPCSKPDSLEECISEAAKLINAARHPVIMAGIEVYRYGLGKEALRLVESSEIPFTTMLSSKSVLPELHPQFIGIYQGSWSRDVIRKQVEESDCLLSLGAWMTDLDTGLFTFNLDPQRMITVGGGNVRIKGHYYPSIELADFISGLMKAIEPRSYLDSHPNQSYQPLPPFVPQPSTALTAKRFYQCVDYYLNDDTVLLAETGDSFCAAPEFHIQEAENFLVQSYYCSIGFCTAAALGVSIARPEKRAVVLTGDGAFQMTAQEVSTMIRMKCPVIVIVNNNDGYLIERKLHQDGLYNDIQMWKYARLPDVFGHNDFAKGIRVTTEEELDTALKEAVSEKNKFFLIETCLPMLDCSAGLERLGNAFRQAKKK